MLNKKSAVRISIEGQSDKKLEIPTFFLRHWKNILVAILSLVVVLVGSLLYVTTQKKAQDISSQYEATLDKVNEEKRRLSISNSETEKTVEEAKKSFTKIDSTLESINNKMKKRGLKTIKLPNVGGPEENDLSKIELLTDYYEDALKELDKKLSSIPLGVPHPGSISSKFGYRSNPFTNRGREMHSGIDLKGRTGDLIKSTASGIVIFSGYDGQYGNVVKIKHSNGYETRYAHLKRTLVKRGEKIEAGGTVGLLGSTGRSTGPHLHYEILKNDKKINPEKYFSL
ncbi:M23 family metallopeptidase [Sphingobacterium rhinopitheci]|uniref:M23 family metallopeptidase n=1 Tax=Sphingobacterium rhinopitheci TaxID=2781960 RepID=UPI001F51EB56|nr:M23 family metallopeptidase [Sphingobacterium rhinopitheci]MCI0920523.1 M23 family metallopeptidase [Sphingobacterium rhinopitheci]